ncbi:MAG: replicative DNA helicase [Bacteroidales bacterium]|jgi:replicative DNA helicase|nr:replicative DNA helicase [Bacteroidales bacterium]MBQ5873412.1 replicative DNA helicase [Bacteroidales bacterium]MBQ5891767.1 replicative DNA helicase [Bacteroidales bacterium]MEE0267197.1 replicative DNA helicase [Bacteroidales bacterium]MEE1251620.1 replicative DNA helicase [Bacteroidales bacterium]
MEQLSNAVKKQTRRLSQEEAFMMNGKIPPQAIEIEESVLGALLLDQNAITNAIDILRQEYFYLEAHQHIYRAISILFRDGNPVDLLSVADQLKKDGRFDEIGGLTKLVSLTNRITSAAHIEYHVRILSEKYIQRELIRVSTETLKDSYDDTVDVLNLLDRTETKFLEINDSNFKSDFHSMDVLLSNTLKEIEANQNSQDETMGVVTGFNDLDARTGGFQKGTLLILAARPAMGKTALALTMARNMAVDFNKPVAIFSLEMTASELMSRLIAAESGIDAKKFKLKGELQDWEKEQLRNKTNALAHAPMYIDDNPGLTIFELRAKCRRLKQKYDIQMVFIDYLQLMSGGETMKTGGNREQEISYISRQLKALSKEIGVPIMALSQLSRAVETRGGSKRPQLSDLRESGAIEQDADMVMFVYRPSYYGIDVENGMSTEGLAKLIIAKHRSGEPGDVNLRFVERFVRFENMYDAVQTPEAMILNSQMNKEINTTLEKDESVPF